MTDAEKKVIEAARKADWFFPRVAIPLHDALNELDAQPEEPAHLCGECVCHLIAGASWYPCALPKGHDGGHRAKACCFQHGDYLGEAGKPPQCPQWPKCIELEIVPKQQSLESLKYLWEASNFSMMDSQSVKSAVLHIRNVLIEVEHDLREAVRRFTPSQCSSCQAMAPYHYGECEAVRRGQPKS